ncbi:MAG: DnaD domain protein [Ruminococcus sp.]|nr:DnaD domain protein [Ruminococcus sp.]
MTTFKINNIFQTNATLIANDFIDNYMAKANGEFVKVYLFLLRHKDNPDLTLTPPAIADCLNLTENDILRALRYWESEGLLNLEHLNTSPSSLAKGNGVPEPVKQKQAAEPPIKRGLSTDPAKVQKDLKSLLFIAEQYLGKTLSKTDVDAITYFYESLGMSADLIEYLIESCVENGHTSIHYIQKVAISWSDAGVLTKEQAKQHSTTYNKNCYTVLNAFGIKNRGPAASELAFIRKWTEELGFSLEIIQEACNRTIAVTHQPSFEYADSILENWKKNKVHYLRDIAALDAAFQKEKNSRKTPVSRQQAPQQKNLNNFERRTYDMDSLEQRLLNSN